VRTVLAIDGGGTRTRAWLYDRSSRQVHDGYGGPANARLGHPWAFRSSLTTAVRGCLASWGAPLPARVDCVVWAMPAPADLVRRCLSALVQADHWLSATEVDFALMAGLGEREGAAVVAGTGVLAGRRDSAGGWYRSDGWGPLMGDEGGGYWIGQEALRAVARARDGRGPATVMLRLLLERAQVGDLRQLIPVLYAGRLPQAFVASLAVMVSRAAAGGDGVAARILRRAGRRLAAALASVASDAGGRLLTARATYAGGVFRCPLVRETFVRCVSRRIPGLSLVCPSLPPVAGGILLAVSGSPEVWEDLRRAWVRIRSCHP